MKTLTTIAAILIIAGCGTKVKIGPATLVEAYDYGRDYQAGDSVLLRNVDGHGWEIATDMSGPDTIVVLRKEGLGTWATEYRNGVVIE